MKRSQPQPLRRDILDAIRALGATQGGVVARAQLIEIGLTARNVLKWAERGDLLAVARGVYALDRPVSALGERWAAHLSVGPGSVIAGDSAIAALDLITTPRKPVHLIMRSRPPRRQAGIAVRRRSDLYDDEIVDIDGLRHSSFAYAFVDIAGHATPDRLDRVLDRAVKLRLFDPVLIEQTLGRRQASPAARAVDAAVGRLDHTAGENRSELERRVIALIRDSHLPPVAVNARVGEFEVDVLFPGTRAIVEADGRDSHSSPAEIAADIAKQRTLEAYGFAVMRVDWADANYGTHRTIERIDRFRLANQLPPVPGPPVHLDLGTPRIGP